MVLESLLSGIRSFIFNIYNMIIHLKPVSQEISERSLAIIIKIFKEGRG